MTGAGRSGGAERSAGRPGRMCRLFVAVDPSEEAVAHLGALVDGLQLSRDNAASRSTRLAARDGWHITLAFLGAVPVERTEDARQSVERAVLDFAPPGSAPWPAGSATADALSDGMADADGTAGVRSAEGGRAARDGAFAGGGAPGDGAGYGDRRGGGLGGGGQSDGRDGESEGIRVRFEGGGTFGRGGFSILWAGVGGDVPGLHRLAVAVRRELRVAELSYDIRDFRPHLTISRPGARVNQKLVAADVEALNAYKGPLWTVDAVHLVMSDWVEGASGVAPRYTRLSSAPLPRF